MTIPPPPHSQSYTLPNFLSPSSLSLSLSLYKPSNLHFHKTKITKITLMELQLPVPAPLDFNFDSACSTPYMSAPSSPQRFGNFFYSAPTSPSTSIIPFNWEEKPGIPKMILPNNRVFEEDRHGGAGDLEDFAFDFSGHLEKPSVSADELFHKGKIRPLKPPPRLQSYNGGFDEPDQDFYDLGTCKSAISSPRSPISLKKKAFSPRGRKPFPDFDPFEEALKNETCQKTERGREKERDSDSKFVRKPKTRSLSPFRVSDILYEQDQEKESANTDPNSNSTTASSSFFESFSLYRAYKKLKLKDLLLFRSASEGRETSAESVKKYEVLTKRRIYNKSSEDLRNSSFRSTDSASSGGGSVSKRRGMAAPLSAHEYHYKVNRAVSEEMRRKTFLPYKQGLLGCLGFNPALHDISRAGSMTRA